MTDPETHEQRPPTSSPATDREPSPATTPPPPSPRPPKGPRVRLIALATLVLAIGFVGGVWWGPAAKQRTGMMLGRVARDETPSRRPAEDDSAPQFYTCGMHPWVILPDGDSLCPICHMELTPLDPDKFTGEISIDPVVTQNMGVRVEPVTVGPVVRTIRTVGTIDFDETRVRDVNIKAEGWIERLFVDYEGAEVEANQPLFEFYSPKLYSAQSEYLSALRMRGDVGAEFLPDAGLNAERLIGDARMQLEYLDVTSEQIAALERSGVPAKTITIASPHGGVVIAKHANEGMRVDRGMRVYQIADLSSVWVMVSLYEYQLPFVSVGQKATMSLPYIPGQRFEGRVVYVYPFLDASTRQVRVRLEFENPDQLLKPGMFVSVELRSTLARERTLAPRSAVIDTGERQVAFVSLGEGRFEPRDVLMGVETEHGIVEILDGLTPGEMVVTSGQFLLDSEARIRESLAKMLEGNLASEQKAVVAVAGRSELASLPPEVDAGLRVVLDRYFAIGTLMAGDTLAGTAEPARELAAAVDELLTHEIPDAPRFWRKHDEIATVRGKALQVAGSSDLETARLALADLSIALAKLVKATGVPPSVESEVQQLHCPMYREGQGGSIWLQPAGDVRNPFYGSVMLKCFDDRIALPVTGRSGAASPTGDDERSEEPATSRTTPLVQQTPDPQADAPPTPEPIASDVQSALDEAFGAYLEVQVALTKDELATLDAPMTRLREAMNGVVDSAPAALTPLVVRVRDAASLDPASLETFRAGFRELSDAMLALVAAAPPSAAVAPAVYHAYCPMVKANWLQLEREVANPYAPYMLRCGSIKAEFTARNDAGDTP